MIQHIVESIQTSIELSKCRRCACMRKSLERIRGRLEDSADPRFYPLFCEAKSAIERLEPPEYT